MTVNHGEDFSNLLEFIKSETRYQLYRTKLNASVFGIPQERERIFIVGFRPDISCESFSSPTSATGPLYDQLPDKMPSKYALESVEGLPNQVIRVHTDAVRKRFEAVPQGGRDRGSYSDRLRPDMPSGTVMIGSSAGGARPFIHPYEPRAWSRSLFCSVFLCAIYGIRSLGSFRASRDFPAVKCAAGDNV